MSLPDRTNSRLRKRPVEKCPQCGDLNNWLWSRKSGAFRCAWCGYVHREPTAEKGEADGSAR